MSNPKIGEVIKGEAFRDAIHVAIAPVIAGEDLWSPATGLAFCTGSTDTVREANDDYGEKVIGVTDPFLRDEIRKGQRFYMFLMPNTVSGMRHEWDHPAFATPKQMNESKKWLAAFADKWHFRYEDMILSAQEDEGCIVAQGRDLHSASELDEGDEKEFWKHIEILTGKEFSAEHREKFGWSCTC